MAQLISRYCIAILKVFFNIYCQNMLKNEIFIHKFCPQSVLKHSGVHFQGVALKFWKIWIECDLMDIDGATHFKVLQCNFKSFFNIYCQNMFKNDIFIHKFCPQSVLKHSMVHFQGIAMIYFLKIWMRFKGHRWLNSFLNRSKNNSGVWMGFKGHRWRNSFLG